MITTYTSLTDVVAFQTDLVNTMEASPHGAADALARAIVDPVRSRNEADELDSIAHTYTTVEVAMGLLQAAAQLVVAHEILSAVNRR